MCVHINMRVYIYIYNIYVRTCTYYTQYNETDYRTKDVSSVQHVHMNKPQLY